MSTSKYDTMSASKFLTRVFTTFFKKNLKIFPGHFLDKIVKLQEKTKVLLLNTIKRATEKEQKHKVYGYNSLYQCKN